MSKRIYLSDSQYKLAEGINLYADAVKSTLGPSGKCVIISNGNGEEPIVTKDGVTVGNSIDSDDIVMNTAIQLIKKVASKMDEDAGDGTTTASVLCRELILLGMELRSKEGFDAHRFKKTIYNELEIIINKIKEKSIFLPLEEIGKIALTSANNDHEIAKLFQIAFNNARESGHINIVQSVTGESFVDILKGFVIDIGYIDRRFANNPISGFFEASKCNVIIYDNEFTDKKEMIKLIERSSKINSSPILIFAKDYSKDVLTIVDYNNQAVISSKICLIKNQLRNDEYANLLSDISNYTGTEPIQHFDEFDAEFGEANNVVVKQGYAIFGKNEGTVQDMFVKYLSLLEEAAAEEKSPSYANDILKRVDRMRNGITTLYVGGNSDIEITEKMHRVQDAYRACKAALRSKVIMGGGQSLVLFSKDNSLCDQYELVFSKTIRQPFIEILKNSLHGDKEILNIKESISFEKGYNAKTREFENLYDSGILDPIDVIINGLKNAVSIALTILSTECLIVEMGNDPRYLTN